MIQEIIRLNDVSKRYFLGKSNEFEVLHKINISIDSGEFLGVFGESGSGKSTLMNILGLLSPTTTGEYYLDRIDISKLSDFELSKLRNQKIGFVFQNFNLIQRFTALENVQLPMLYLGISRKESKERALELLSLVGMEDRANHRPNELSGGQNQRVAIARALATNPNIILADEPTGALDYFTSAQIMKLFHILNEKGKTVIMVTHNKDLMSDCTRVITLKDGKIISDLKRGAHNRELD